MKKIKKQRGFTLVELIVVLVILAVLAALLVPALTRYIDKAKKSQVIAETRMLHTAIQTEMSELYAKPEWQNYLPANSGDVANFSKGIIASKIPVSNASENCVSRYNDIANLSEVAPLLNGKGSYGGIISTNGKLYFLMYYNGGDYIGLYFNQTGEVMALRVPDEAPRYEGYLFGNQLRCVRIPDSTDIRGNYLDRSVILYSIGYLKEPPKV